MSTRPPLPPFDQPAVAQKVRMAEDGCDAESEETVAGICRCGDEASLKPSELI